MLHTRRKVAANITATCRSDQSPHAGVLENLGEDFCPCNRILSPQQVSQMQSDLIFFCDLLQRQNSVAETKTFIKILISLEAICRYDVSPVAATSIVAY